jgi:hypothetical protein
MAYYPGDTYTFVLSITTATGVAPTITSSPVISVANVSGSVVVSSQSMAVVSGTSNQIWLYNWNTTGAPSGDYIGIVSYAHDGNTYNSQLLTRIQIGDTYVTGVVALDATVAKEASVALDATVAHASDLSTIDPDNSTVVLAIKAKTDNLPSDPAATTDVTSVGSMVTDIHNVSLGTWSIDKTQNPPVMTLYTLSNAVLAQFTLTDTGTTAARTVV